MIHIVHRSLAYLIFILILILTCRLFALRKNSLLINKTWWLSAGLTLLQLILGVLTVLTSSSIIPGKWEVFEWMAQMHQLTAMFILLSLVWLLFIVRRNLKSAD